MQTAPALVEEAISEHRRGEVAGAIVLLREALKSEPLDCKALYHLALALCHQGEFGAAVSVLERLLDQVPNDAAAHNLLGLAFHRLDRAQQALTCFDRAIEWRLDFAEAFGNRGNLLAEMGRNEEALQSYDRAVSLDGGSFEDWSNRGVLLFESKQFEKALHSFDRAIALRPECAEARVNRGNALRALGRYDEAIAEYDAAIKARSQFAEAYSGRGAAFAAAGRLHEAIASYDLALSLAPKLMPALIGRGHGRLRTERASDALKDFESAIAAAPNLPDAWRMRSLALIQLGRFEDALSSSERALSLSSDHPADHLIRGVILYNLCRDAAALESFNRAHSLDPGNGRVLAERATVLTRLGRHDQAVADIRRAIKFAPQDPMVAGIAADVFLLHGDWQRGWKLYEHRFDADASSIPLPMLSVRDDQRVWPDFLGARWNGEPPKAGESLVLLCEQGIGDSIQFSRFASELASRGHLVALFAPPVLAPLLATVPGVGKVVSGIGALKTLAPIRSIPLLSIPAAIGLSIDTIPNRVPYLSVEPERTSHWVSKLCRDSLNVGIVWQGNPEFRFDQGRSIPLAEFAPLANIPGVRLFSMQKGHGLEQIEQVAFKEKIEILPGYLDSNSLLDTAAIVTHLDLIVTADTMMAHLAGALGKSVYVALRANVVDWRWLLDRDDSPWYPTARLFRQAVEGEWGSVFSRIAEAVCQLREQVPATWGARPYT